DGAENVNVTGLIANPSFETGNINPWACNPAVGGEVGVKTISKYGITNADGQYIFNTWVDKGTSYSLSQTLSGLPAGKYQLSAVVASGANYVITLSAGTASADFTIPAAEAGTDAEKIGHTHTVEFDYSSGNVDLKVASPNWFKADNFQLTFLREFTNAELAAAIKVQLQTLIGDVEAIDVETNVGDGVFQIPASAVTALQSAISDAQDVYDNAEATVEIVQQAIDDLKAAVEAYKNAKLNEPEEGQRFIISPASADHPMFANAITATLGETGDNNKTGYTFSAEDTPKNVNLAQAFIFTNANNEEHPNYYYISIEREEGTVYLTNGANNGSAAGWNKSQIQGTTDATKKIPFEVAWTGTGFNLKNTGDGGALIAIQAGGPMYTESGNNDLLFTEAASASVEVNIAAGKYATRIFPFVPELEGVTFYSCESVNKETSELGLDKVESPKANTPYVLYAENEVEGTLTGYGTATTLDPVTAGLLVGSFESIKIEAGNYVLQTNPETDVQAFYIVGESGFESTEYRAYLVKSADIKGRDAFFFGEGEATGINGIEQGMNESMVIYNLQGQRVAMPTRGIYIVNGKKVMVK
ncbi:MAG: FIVAR domain-containing protein, partial [Prevotellaceae bacterium]|nr:FIVAR domain-containing protein [Prevotellaceae bacterium]